MKELAIYLPAQGRDLEPLLEQAAQFLQAAKAGSTRRAYASDLRDFAAFCEVHEFLPLPSSPEVIALYIAGLASRVKVATIQRRLSTRERCVNANLLCLYGGKLLPNMGRPLTDTVCVASSCNTPQCSARRHGHDETGAK